MNWRNTTEYRVWRAGVIRRDARCQVCDSLQNREAHHINHATYFPEQRFEITNGITLCATCHSHFHNNYKNSTKEKCTIKDYLNFKCLIDYLKGL